MRHQVCQYFYAGYEHIRVLNVTSRMNMKGLNIDLTGSYNFFQHIQLLQSNTEFTFLMTHRNFQIATCQDIGPDPYTHRITIPIFLTELLQIGKTVYINMYSQAHRLFNFFKCNPIGSIKYFIRFNSGMQRKLYFIDAATI